MSEYSSKKDFDNVDWNCFKKRYKLDLSTTETFIMMSSTLKKIIENSDYLSSIYEKILLAAKIPSDAPDWYGIHMKFKDE